MTVAQYRADPVCHLSYFNYKLNARIGPTKDAQLERLTVLDTGAGPNLIRSGLVPEEFLAQMDKSREVVNLSSASKHRLDVLGLIPLTITVADLTIRQTFVVVRQLGADVILGCHFIDKALEFIAVQKRHVILTSGAVVPIIRRRAIVPIEGELPEPKELRNRNPAPTNLIRCAKRVILDPNSETNVLVSCDVGGTRLLEPMLDLYGKSMVTMANGVADVRPRVPFVVRVANLSDAEVVIAKNQRLGTAVASPVGQVFAISFEGDPSPSDVKLEATKEAPQGGESTAEAPPRLTVDDLDLKMLSDEQQRQVRNMLQPFSGMWQGQLGEVTATEHRIDLAPGARPQFSQPYRAGPGSREVIEKHIEDMKEKGVIEPAQSQWAAPVVLAPKSDGTLRFCIDYRRLNAVTIKDSYPLPRMDDCLDSLGTASFFTTLDCNIGY